MALYDLNRHRAAGLVALLALSACGQAGAPPPSDAAMDAAAVAEPMPQSGGEGVAAARSESLAIKAASTAPSETAPADTPAPNQPPAGVAAPMLAYAYSATLQAPSGKVTGLMRGHEAACARAGPAVCQVVGASASGADDNVSASLSLRAEPRWLATFRSGLERDANAAEGKVIGEEVRSEDLTRSITDTSARLRALTSLRGRLEALIASRPGKLSDLLEVERELARVQGDIDSLESNLAVMRGRVAMSAMDMSYTSRVTPVQSGAFSPLGHAINGFLGTMAGSLAAIITFLALVLPFALVIGPAVWLAMRWRAGRKAQAHAAKAAQPAP